VEATTTRPRGRPSSESAVRSPSADLATDLAGLVARRALCGTLRRQEGAALKIDAYAREIHHASHIVPVWNAIKPRARGTFYLTNGVALPGVPNTLQSGDYGGTNGPMLVSASGALINAAKAGRTHLAIMEHGAGQSFHGDTGIWGQTAADNPSYAGGLN